MVSRYILLAIEMKCSGLCHPLGSALGGVNAQRPTNPWRLPVTLEMCRRRVSDAEVYVVCHPTVHIQQSVCRVSRLGNGF